MLALIWEDNDMLDLIIRGGTVVDGTGAAARFCQPSGVAACRLPQAAWRSGSVMW